jgi:hypothetical protein
MREISKFSVAFLSISLLLVFGSGLVCGDASLDAGAVYPTTGTLHIDGDPVGMEISLDGKNVGTIPESGVLILENIPVGEHSLNASYSGYMGQDMWVNVPDGLPAEIRVTLQEETSGSLDLSSTPPGAQIYVDDLYTGLTPAVVNATVGSHRVLLRQEGYQDWSTEVTVSGGQMVSVSGSLIPVSSTPVSPPAGGPGFLVTMILVGIGCVIAFGIWKK